MSVINLAYGAGGSLTQELIKEVFLPELGNPLLATLDDSAILEKALITNKRLAFTTDSYVVQPIFFPGGDIGKLAVCGTVNDLCMAGAIPKVISLGLIIEEGLAIKTLEKIIHSIAITTKEAGVKVVTGDTKVVEKGKGDKIFINTAGIGIINDNIEVSNNNAKPGDIIIISGTLGEHEVAVINAREDFGLEGNLKSDVAPLVEPITELLNKVGSKLHTLKDPTRGGLATALTEIASSSGVTLSLEEKNIPVNQPVFDVCEILGLDYLYLANEGKFIIIASPDSETIILEILHKHPLTQKAAVIGKVEAGPGEVILNTLSGGSRLLRPLSGMHLPRIC